MVVCMILCCSWFEEQAACRAQRAQADVCLPRLPGPGPGPAAATAAVTSVGSEASSSSSNHHEEDGSSIEGVGFQVGAAGDSVTGTGAEVWVLQLQL
jgi:hypothetical protein